MLRLPLVLIVALLAILACVPITTAQNGGETVRIRIVDPEPWISRRPSLMYDDTAGLFRLWYRRNGAATQSELWMRTSPDGVTWSAPTVVWEYDGDSAVVVTEDGLPYRTLYFRNSPPPRGPTAAYSSDGISWQTSGDPVFLYPQEGQPPVYNNAVGDILDPFYDPLRDRYGAFVKLYGTEFPDSPSMAGAGIRLTGLSYADETFTKWTDPVRTFVPDALDDPGIEFYGAACCLVRDGRLVAFLRVLRDDIDDGIGYTVLAWSDDGMTWERAREPWLDRCPIGFDSAIAWVSDVVEHDGKVFIAYQGHPDGHKLGTKNIGIRIAPASVVSVPDGQVEGCDSLLFS